MGALFRHEWKLGLKSLLIWSLTVGLIGMYCVTLYSSMTEEMEALSDSFSNMGAFSDAFGMSTLGIGTLAGFFATEVGTVHGLGSGMFAAILAIVLLSKEEDGHTGEFLYTLPVSRGKVVAVKAAVALTELIAFSLITGVCYLAGMAYLGEYVEMADFAKFMLSAFLMNAEIAGICLAVSAFLRRNQIGLGIGIALMLYFFDLVGRVVPDAKDAIVIGPYSYANPSEIFAGKEIPGAAYLIAAAVIVCAAVCMTIRYRRKDLAS